MNPVVIDQIVRQQEEINYLRQKVKELEEGAKFFHEIENLKAQLAACKQRINELEATIKSHGIPVKSFSGGEAHYCMSQYGSTPPTSANGVLDDQLKVTKAES